MHTRRPAGTLQSLEYCGKTPLAPPTLEQALRGEANKNFVGGGWAAKCMQTNRADVRPRIADWSLLAVIAFLSLSRASIRPVTPVGHSMEHFLSSYPPGCRIRDLDGTGVPGATRNRLRQCVPGEA
jgi:hypothetical protein